MIVKTVFRIDSTSRLLRMFRIVRNVGRVGDGRGYSTKTSVALSPKLFGFRREWNGWILTALGLRLHYVRSYGGIFV